MANKKMIILEDDKLTQHFYRRIFLPHFDLRIFNSHIPFFDSFYADPCDILIVDISLEKGMNGLEITQKLRSEAEYKYLPIICVTAHSFQQDKINARESGINDLIIKPVSISALRKIINKYV